MNETNFHLPPVQGENGLFVPITLEEMAKSPEIFGRAGAVCSEVAETPPVVPQELQNAVTEPKVQRLNCANASEIFYLVVNILNQQKSLWRYQNHFYMKENNVYVPYNKKVFICRVYSDVQRLAMSSHSLPFAVLQMSWKCELICTKESQMTNAIPIVRTAF